MTSIASTLFAAVALALTAVVASLTAIQPVAEPAMRLAMGM